MYVSSFYFSFICCFLSHNNQTFSVKTNFMYPLLQPHYRFNRRWPSRVSSRASPPILPQKWRHVFPAQLLLIVAMLWERCTHRTHSTTLPPRGGAARAERNLSLCKWRRRQSRKCTHDCSTSLRWGGSAARTRLVLESSGKVQIRREKAVVSIGVLRGSKFRYEDKEVCICVHNYFYVMWLLEHLLDVLQVVWMIFNVEMNFFSLPFLHCASFHFHCSTLQYCFMSINAHFLSHQNDVQQ